MHADSSVSDKCKQGHEHMPRRGRTWIGMVGADLEETPAVSARAPDGEGAPAERIRRAELRGCAMAELAPAAGFLAAAAAVDFADVERTACAPRGKSASSAIDTVRPSGAARCARTLRGGRMSPRADSAQRRRQTF
jgi:hypothetical protein